MKVDKAPNSNIAINILSDVVVGVCEHGNQLSVLLAANYIVHYRAFLEFCTDGTDWTKSVIEFKIFITDQALSVSAAAYIA